jgi:hypothetical protein
MTRPSASVLAIGVLLVLCACSIASVQTPDIAAIPSASLDARDSGATGPIVELGSGVTEGVGWRYSIYPVEDGWCTQIETATVTAGGCGDILPAEGEVFGSYGTGTQLDGGMTAVEGTVSGDVATVWVILEDGRRAPAELMPLDEAGLEGQAFVRLLPNDLVVTHLQAIAPSGEILETVELP